MITISEEEYRRLFNASILGLAVANLASSIRSDTDAAFFMDAVKTLVRRFEEKEEEHESL